MLLDLLHDKGPKAYDHLCDAILDNGTQTFIVTELNQLFEKKLQELYNASE